MDYRAKTLIARDMDEVIGYRKRDVIYYESAKGHY